jgi:hypothetical protein
MRWRRLHPHELDHEVLWLSVSVVGALVAWVWLHSGLPTPRCTFHDWTGIPCPGCGATRSVRHLMHGNLPGALHMNPLFFIGVGLTGIYDLYAATVLALRLPRLRLDEVPTWLGTTARFGIPALIVLNWAWLIVHKV